MKLHIALLAGLLISTSASADVVGTYTRQQANSDILIVSITDEPSNHPYCAGKEARAVVSSGGVEFKLARGCWTVEGDGFVVVDMFAYSDGREMSFPVRLQDLQLTPRFATMFDAFNRPPVSRVAATVLIDGEKPGITDAMAAGACVMTQQAMDYANTQQEKAFVGKLRATLADGLKVTDAELNGYCFELLKATAAMADAEK